jgi:hypothetical protein
MEKNRREDDLSSLALSRDRVRSNPKSPERHLLGEPADQIDSYRDRPRGTGYTPLHQPFYTFNLPDTNPRRTESRLKGKWQQTR